MSAIPVRADKSQTGVGSTDWIVLNKYADSDTAISVEVTGTVTYTVVGTLDRPLVDTQPFTEIDNPDLQNLTASATGNFAYPVLAIRLNITAGTGTARIIVMQEAN